MGHSGERDLTKGKPVCRPWQGNNSVLSVMGRYCPLYLSYCMVCTALVYCEFVHEGSSYARCTISCEKCKVILLRAGQPINLKMRFCSIKYFLCVNKSNWERAFIGL